MIKAPYEWRHQYLKEKILGKNFIEKILGKNRDLALP